MNIAQIVSGGGVDGATRHAIDLSLLLRQRGHEVTLVCRPDSWAFHEAAKHPDLPCHLTTFRRRPGNFKAFQHFLRDRQIQIVHTHKSSANAFGGLLRAFYQVPAVATAHSRHLQLHWRLNDHVIAPTAYTARFLRRVNRVPEKRMSVIPMHLRFSDAVPSASELAALRRSLGIAPGVFLVGIVGTVERRKGLLTLARALPMLRARGLDVAVVAVGSRDARYERRVRRYLASQQIEHLVTLAGAVDNIGYLMPAFDLVCLPSREEQMPVAILEAMAARRPVLVSPVGGLPELIRDDVDGRYAAVGEPATWADAIYQLATDSDARKRLGAAGRRRVEDYCDPDHIIPRIERVYDAVRTTSLTHISANI